MKIKISTIILTAAVMLAAVIGLSSCSKDPHDQMNEQGYTVSVKFDPNGATINTTNSVISDVFNPDNCPKDADGNPVITLLRPDSDLRIDKGYEIIKPGHFLAGWYTERTPIDENDLSKGYTYSGRWDFDNDKLTLDKDKTYDSSVPALTLYAAWIPNFTFEFYSQNTDGSFSLYKSETVNSITIPEWKENEVKISMGSFPQISGKTFVSAFADENMTEKLSGTVRGQWSPETATAGSSTIRIYTTWENYDHRKIYSANDLIENADSKAFLEICADLDFENKRWPGVFTTGEFNGRIEGNGHKISNVSISSTTSGSRGLFSRLGANAVISNISFENITHTVNVGVVKNGDSYGLLSGQLKDGAAFDNVLLDGKLTFGKDCENLENYPLTQYTYSMHLICGNLETTNVSGITATVTADKADNTDFSLNIGDNGVITLLFDSGT